MDENMTPERRCPACGASMPAEARFCGSCGMDTLPAETPAPAEAPAPPVAAPPVAVPPAAAAATEAPAANAADQVDRAATDLAEGKLCNWCDARNPQEATQCVSCGATFPTPEGDEALERAARARIQSMESELKQQQAKRGGWWPFRSR